MLYGKSLVKESCFPNRFFISQILLHFYERRKIIRNIHLCHDFIELLCYTLFYLFSQQKQVHLTIIHIKSTFKKQRIILLSQNTCV